MYRVEIIDGIERYYYGDTEITRDEYEAATNREPVVWRFTVFSDGRIKEVGR